MRRRGVLQSMAAATTATAVALAGCNGTGGNGNGCGTPNGDLAAALPRGNGFTNPSVDANNNASEVGGATEHVLGSYVTDEETYLFVIGRYDSNSDARTAASTEDNWLDFGYDVTGYVVVEEYAYVALGPDESTVADLLAAAGPLNADCVDSELTVL
jgi:hypothetical protein